MMRFFHLITYAPETVHNLRNVRNVRDGSSIKRRRNVRSQSAGPIRNSEIRVSAMIRKQIREIR